MKKCKPSVAPFITWMDEWLVQNRQLFNVIEITDPKCFIKVLLVPLNCNTFQVVHAINDASVSKNHNKIVKINKIKN